MRCAASVSLRNSLELICVEIYVTRIALRSANFPKLGDEDSRQVFLGTILSVVARFGLSSSLNDDYR